MSRTRNERFRELVERDEILVLPGSYDALSAKIVEKTGAEAAYVSGAGISNTKLGLADMGLTSFGEMRDRIQYITSAISLPVFADADTGYGNALHVRRTVREYERIGVSALHLEDQQFPKRCGHFDDKSIVPTEEMVRKIHAATDAREDENFTVVARTDARAVDGVEAAIERSNRFVEAGADLIFPEAPQDRAEMETFCREIDAPVMANMVEDGKTPMLPADELEALGYDLVIFPNSLLRTAMQSMVETAEHIDEAGTTGDILDRIADFELRNELTDFDHIKDMEAQYGE